jgi:adenylate kinase
VVKDKSCHEGYDDKLKTWIVDEDKLLDEIENQLEEGGNIIDWHVCDIFPERLVDLVVVLQANTTMLYDRLKSRLVSSGAVFAMLCFTKKKFLGACSEIMQVCANRQTTKADLLIGDTENKLQENLDSEIMQVILEEARESYNEEIVIELQSNTTDEIDSNVERIAQWVESWILDHPEGV